MRKRIGGVILTLAAIFGGMAATSTTADAQWRNDDRRYSRRDRDDDDRKWRRNRDRRDDRRARRNDRRDRRDDRYGRYGNGRYGNGDYRNSRYGNRGYNSNGELNRGYQQGIETGASDGQRGQSYSPQRSRHYRNASTQAFREGFVRGYDQGYRQYSGNGRYRNGSGIGIADILGGILGRP